MLVHDTELSLGTDVSKKKRNQGDLFHLQVCVSITHQRNTFFKQNVRTWEKKRTHHVTLITSCRSTVDSPQMWAAAPNDSLFLKGRTCLLAMPFSARYVTRAAVLLLFSPPSKWCLTIKKAEPPVGRRITYSGAWKPQPVFPQTTFHRRLNFNCHAGRWFQAGVTAMLQAPPSHLVVFPSHQHAGLCWTRMVALCCRLSRAGITSTTPACPADRVTRGTPEKKKNSFYLHLLICNSHPRLKVGPCFLMCFWIFSLFLMLFLIKGLKKKSSGAAC